MAFDISGSIARGGKRAEEMADQNRLPSGKFEQVNWFSIKDKETIILRFLDDANEWLSVLQHPFAPTRPAPDFLTDDAKKRWPQSFSPVCRKTPEFVQFFPDGCYICDEMHTVRPNPRGKTGKYFSQVRLWARAVERVQVLVQNAAESEKYQAPIGDLLGYRDAEVEVDERDDDGKPTGKKIMKKIIVINMALKNFFGPLQGYADVYKTVLDRDYSITRKGSDQNTDYNLVPLDPIEKNGAVLHMGKTPEVIDGQPTGRLLRDAYFDDGPDLVQMISDRLDDSLYHRFFDDRVPVPERERDTDNGNSSSNNGAGASAPVQNGSSPASNGAQGASESPAETPAPADQNATAAKLAAMRNRVKGDNPAGAPSQDVPSSPEDPATELVGAADGGKKMVDFS